MAQVISLKDSSASPPGGSGEQSVKKPARARRKPKEEASPLQKDLVLRVQRLRSAAKEISRTYVSNLERDILELVDLITSGKSGKRKVKPRMLKGMMGILEDLTIKPEKGRRKDLKRIEEAVAAMMRLLDSGKG